MVAALAPFDPRVPSRRRVWLDLPFAELRRGGVYALIMVGLWLVFSP